jgi:pyruvate/2-oxoglutarate dehydrogenase complex dihydrolipoamide acyltransferase (E2) component
MTIEIRLPRLGTAMTEGTLTTWLVEEGDEVSEGTPLYEIETDKVETEVPAPSSGVIRLLAQPGETYQVGTLLAVID